MEAPLNAPTKIETAVLQWEPGSFVALYGTTPETAKEVVIVGWVSGMWGLDFRVDEGTLTPVASGVWSLTHIPTGYHFCTIHDGVERSKEIAAEIAGWGDWSKINTPEAIKGAFSEKAKETARRNDEVVFGAPPLYSQITHEGAIADQVAA